MQLMFNNLALLTQLNNKNDASLHIYKRVWKYLKLVNSGH